MAIDYNNLAELHDHRLKQQRLVFEVEITANGTPADKVHSVDIPGAVYLRTEGKTAEADNVEDLSGDFTTAADNNAGDSQFGILLDLGDVQKVKKVTITEQTSLATSLTVAPAGSDYKTDEKNIAIDITGTGLNLASESPRLLVEIEYDAEK